LLKSLLVDGVIAGVGGVLVFLPQIVILFAFILALEDSGYLPRAAFLLDRFMGKVGLSGRSFIPLLSSFACAIPGIMATRVISNWRDRLSTILIAPLMTCSARLPVYALLIAAFIPGPGRRGDSWMSLVNQSGNDPAKIDQPLATTVNSTRTSAKPTSTTDAAISTVMIRFFVRRMPDTPDSSAASRSDDVGSDAAVAAITHHPGSAWWHG
jgi:hypothetical protein